MTPMKNSQRLQKEALEADGYKFPSNPKNGVVVISSNEVVAVSNVPANDGTGKVNYDGEDRTVAKNSLKFYINGKNTPASKL